MDLARNSSHMQVITHKDSVDRMHLVSRLGPLWAASAPPTQNTAIRRFEIQLNCKERPDGMGHCSQNALSLTGPLTGHLRDTYGTQVIFLGYTGPGWAGLAWGGGGPILRTPSGTCMRLQAPAGAWTRLCVTCAHLYVLACTKRC